MKRIDILSNTQRARMAEWRDRWIAIGLCTEPADRDRAEWAVRECYACAGLAAPKRIIWVPNPLVGALAFSDAAIGKSSPDIPADVAVGDAVSDAVGDAVSGADLWWRYLGGQFWAGWFWGPAYATFFLDVCGLALSPEIMRAARANEAITSSACWWWPHRDFAIICERPRAIRRDAEGRLHSPDLAHPGGSVAAVEWDGWGVYATHGQRIVPCVEHEDCRSVPEMGFACVKERGTAA